MSRRGCSRPCCSSSGGAGPCSSDQRLSVSEVLASLRAWTSASLGTQRSKPVAARSCSAATNAVVVPERTQASFPGAVGSQLRNRAEIQPPRFLTPFLRHRQKQQGCPGSRSGARRFLVLRSIARRTALLMLRSAMAFRASVRTLSAVAAMSVVGLTVRDFSSVNRPPGSRGTRPKTA